MINLTFYSEIAPEDAQLVLNQLRSDPRDAVEVRINSPGGSVHAALAIFNALRPRKPTVYIDGVAASAASVIAMAGQRVVAAENAIFMIHDPWIPSTSGNAAELRREAETLDLHRDAMLTAYDRSGISRKELIQMLAEETWMNASEALRLGFIDEIAEAISYAAHSESNYLAYRRTPQELITMTRSTSVTHSPQRPEGCAAAAPQQPSAESAPQGAAPNPASHADFLAAQRARNDEIAGLSRSFPLNPEVQSLARVALADPGMSIDRFRADMLAALGRGSEPLGGGHGNGIRVAFGGHSGGTGSDFVGAASDALVIRAGIRIENPHAGARDIGGMSLSDIMRACVSRGGRWADTSTGGRSALVRAAMSTSDFPAILENTLGKALRGGYESEPATYQAWTRRVLVPDFKEQSRVLLGSAPELLLVPEGADYTLGSMDEDKSVPYKVSKFGRIVQLTWEALVNDDLSAFLRITQAMGQAAARAEGDAVYRTFSESDGAGVLMQDGKPLFHSDHKNLATPATVISADALGAARVLLRRQTAIGGGALNLPPRFLLVAPEHEQAAEVLLAAAARSLSQGEENALIPAWLAKLELVVEARLTDDAFWLLTSPDSVDTLERAHLEEDNGPRITEEEGFNNDSRKYKVRHVFGARWLDWRGAVRVPLN
ncbi:Clp protease ClpP [Stenotrophomonas maltophilia]|uniref:head maturation protease, ClpP-related n=1 Tax=Stenotrophomonas maltophilia TaxID=40324 RepID=UPI001EC52C9A|nr:head maturation protease, ClpP-related [Stenotrophomonas maltophilia]MBN5137996.1 Clp protease ClpP [Stenotrophomonas maltophilia]MDZ5831372.1 Clp protease ClpP [Stenotrophomonas maltophilia]HEL4163319.1 Clp protease ClpP [Stenotrophomonas maltophilia]